MHVLIIGSKRSSPKYLIHILRIRLLLTKVILVVVGTISVAYLDFDCKSLPQISLSLTLSGTNTQHVLGRLPRQLSLTISSTYPHHLLILHPIFLFIYNLQSTICFIASYKPHCYPRPHPHPTHPTHPSLLSIYI